MKKKKPKEKPKGNSRTESTITEMKNSLDRLKGRLRRQKKESENLNIGQQELLRLKTTGKR